MINMNTKRLSEKVVLRNTKKLEDKYFGFMSISDFERIFGVQVYYLDMSLEENQNKQPLILDVAINLFSGDIAYNSNEETLIFEGEFLFIDGIKKFEIHKFHPESDVVIRISTYDEEGVRRYLGDINRIN